MDKKKLIEVLKQRASGLWGGRESLINNLAARKRLQLKFDPNKPLGFWHPSLEFVDVPDKPAPAVQQPTGQGFGQLPESPAVVDFGQVHQPFFQGGDMNLEEMARKYGGRSYAALRGAPQATPPPNQSFTIDPNYQQTGEIETYRDKVSIFKGLNPKMDERLGQLELAWDENGNLIADPEVYDEEHAVLPIQEEFKKRKDLFDLERELTVKTHDLERAPGMGEKPGDWRWLKISPTATQAEIDLMQSYLRAIDQMPEVGAEQGMSPTVIKAMTNSYWNQIWDLIIKIYGEEKDRYVNFPTAEEWHLGPTPKKGISPK